MVAAKCITNPKHGSVYCRGLCRKCYGAAWHLVNSGEETWTTLEKRGAVKPATKAGRKRSSQIYDAVRK